MAALSQPGALARFFFASNISDVVSLEQFAECFPEEHRDSEKLARMYLEFVQHRDRLRKEVVNNIAQTFGDAGAPSQNVGEAIEDLQQMEAFLDHELEQLDEDIAANEKAFAQVQSKLEGLRPAGKASDFNPKGRALEGLVEAVDNAVGGV